MRTVESRQRSDQGTDRSSCCDEQIFSNLEKNQNEICDARRSIEIR